MCGPSGIGLHGYNDNCWCELKTDATSAPRGWITPPIDCSRCTRVASWTNKGIDLNWRVPDCSGKCGNASGGTGKMQTNLEKRLGVLHPGRKIQDVRERLQATSIRLNREIRLILQRRNETLARVSATLNAVSPLQTVGRGLFPVNVYEFRRVGFNSRQSARGSSDHSPGCRRPTLLYSQ